MRPIGMGILVLMLAGALGSEAGPTAEPCLKDTEKLFRESLERYAQQLAKTPDAAPIPVELGGWAALQVPACAVAGFVLLGEGSTPTKGPYAVQLNKLFKYVLVATAAEPVGGASHETWPLAFGILFLAEIQRVQPSADLRAHLGKLVKRLESGQEGEKGWRHGLQPAKGEKYGALIAPSIWCTAALAAAKEQGVAVDEVVLQSAFAMLRKCVGRFGGANYFSYKGTLITPGRSGGVLWVLRRYHAEPGTEAERAQSCLLRRAAYAHNGHGSQAMGFGWAALGAASAGGEANAALWKESLKSLLSVRKSDGSFPPQEWRDLGFPDKEGEAQPKYGRGDGPEAEQTFWPDRMYGEGWNAAWMLLAWQCGLGRGILTVKPPEGAPVQAALDEPAKPDPVRAGIEEAASLLKAGKHAEAASKLDALLREHRGHAELHRLRALAALPALALPPALGPKDLADGAQGWVASNETRALSCLDSALRAREGKGLVPEAFDAGIQALQARIHAKRLVAAVRAQPNSPAWVPLYNAFVRAIQSPMQNPATQGEAIALYQAVSAQMPKKGAPPNR